MTQRGERLQLDPVLRQELLLRSGSPEGTTEGAAAGELLPVVARLDPVGAEVPGLRAVAQFGDVVTARVRLADVIAVRRHRSVRSLKLSREYAPALVVSVPEVRGTAADLRRVTPGGLSGRGVLIAVLDWGLDIAHANFRHRDGSTRVRAIWDQRGGRTSKSPGRFGYGRVIEASDIDAALATADPYAALAYDPADVDPGAEGSHGTHVTDIAAGNGRAAGSAPGVAPGAEILFVHLRGDDTRPEDALGDSVRLLEATAWAVERAAGDPLVCHLSLGRTGGPHDTSPLVVRAFDHLLGTTPGVAVVMSCGNYRAARMHASVRVDPGRHVDIPWEIRDPGPAGAELELWYSGTDALAARLFAPDARPVADLPLGGYAVVREEGRLVASGFHRRNDPNNAANQLDVFVLRGAPAGTWTLRLHGEAVLDGRVEAWIERTASRHQSRFPRGRASPYRTTGSICNGWLPLAVGAYDARAPGRPPLDFSSAGPTRDGRDKPEISAPGGSIVAARSALRRPDGSRAVDGAIAKSGTSMAAPHVSGAAALVFEAVAPRRLPMPVLRWVLLETARRDPPFSPAERLRYGAGRLDVRAAAMLARALATSEGSRPEARLPVVAVRRGTPPVDLGGAVEGVTPPTPARPMSEPDCYLPVLAQVEGKLESINAWDTAGVSLGPVQFNVDRGALFRFLWRLWSEDRALFEAELTAPLGWRMAWHGEHPDLLADTHALHGRGDDAAANAAYLRTGRVGGSGVDAPYRRRLATALRNCVARPHVQRIVADVSSWWLLPALDAIRAERIGPLDPDRPDRAAFVLTGMLLSAWVRFPACLRPVLSELRRLGEVAAKLDGWEGAVRASPAPCSDLVPRLRVQRAHAERVHEGLKIDSTSARIAAEGTS